MSVNRCSPPGKDRLNYIKGSNFCADAITAVVNYNRGCGQKFDTNNNTEGECLVILEVAQISYYPSLQSPTSTVQVFQFSTMLTRVGSAATIRATISSSSSISRTVRRRHITKENHPIRDVVIGDIPQKIREPTKSTLQRPSWESPLTILEPTPCVAAPKKPASDASDVKHVTACKYGSCSCCQKRTCGFAAFKN